MLRFALKTLRHRKASFAGAFVALMCAAALVGACGMLLETGLRGTLSPERYEGAPVIVAGKQTVSKTFREKEEGEPDEIKVKSKSISERAWIPASVADDLKDASGVSRVVSEVTFPAYANGTEFTGHGWESAALTPFTIADGRAPRTAGEVVADAEAGLSVGSKVSIRTTAGNAEYRVTGITEQALPSQATLFFSTAEARKLSDRPGQVSAIGVFGNADAVRGPVDAAGAVVYTGDARGSVEFIKADQSRIQLVSMGGALAGTSLLVAILVVAGTFALSIQQRQRELALLRAIAATPRQVRRLLGREAVISGVVAGAIGAACSIALGFWLHARFVELGAVPENLNLVVSPFPAAAAVFTTVLAAWAATRVSARRLARIRPVEALGDTGLSPRGVPWFRLLAGLVLAGGGVVLTLLLANLNTEAASSPVTMLTALVWTISAALLGPLVAKGAVVLLGLPMRASRISGYLARRNLRASTPRLASVIAPLTLMVAMTCTILFVQTTMTGAAQEQTNAGSRADYVLGPNVPSSTAQAVRQAPGVQAATEVLHTSVRIDLEKYSAQAVSTANLGKTLDLDVIDGSLEDFGTGSVALGKTAAERLGARVGEPIQLTLGDGTPATFSVAAIYSRGLGFGDLTLPHSVVKEHVDNPLGTVLVSAPSMSRAELAALSGGVAVLDQAEVASAGPSNAQVRLVALGLIIGFAAIAVVNTLAMSISDRTRELALLRLTGTTRRQILRMLRLETLTAVLTAVVLGSGISWLTLTAFSTGMTGSATPNIPPLTCLAVIAGTAALALAATALPGRLALRQPPAEAIGVN